MKCLRANYLEIVPGESGELYFNVFRDNTDANGLQDYKHIGWIGKPKNKDEWCFSVDYNECKFMFTQDTLGIILETIKRLNNGTIVYNKEKDEWLVK